MLNAEISFRGKKEVADHGFETLQRMRKRGQHFGTKVSTLRRAGARRGIGVGGGSIDRNHYRRPAVWHLALELLRQRPAEAAKGNPG